MLRNARERAGIKIATVARRCHVTASHLSNVEAGRRTVTPDIVLAYEQAIGEEVKRRGIVTGLAAGVVAPAAVAQLIEHGFAAAMAGRDAEDRWMDRALRLGRDYMQVGATELQGRLAGDLVVVQQHLETPTMWGVAARMLTTYGKTTGDAAEAVRWYRLAAVTADRSEDTSLRVWVRGRAALALGYEGAQLHAAQAMAQEAIGLADEKPSLGLLNALVAHAHVAGVRGDKAGALADLDTARRVFDRAGSDEQISDFAVPEWRFHTFASMLLSRLGDPRAVDEQDAADATRPATLPRFATHIELHRGLMLTRSGDREGGRAYARAALDRLPPERHSQSLRLMLAEVERA